MVVELAVLNSSMSSVGKRIAILAAVLFLPVCIMADSPRYDGIQLVRYVLTTDELADPREYFKQVETGTLIYDSTYRHPTEPPGPAPVDCAATRRIGITFMVNRRVSRSYETLRVQYSWRHVTSDHGSGDESWSVSNQFPIVYGARRNNQVLSFGIVLTDARKVDGLVTVRVSVGKFQLLENAFRLIGCPVSDT